MNILWIEDNPKIEQLKKQLFLDTGLFNHNAHKIIITNCFDDAYNKVENSLYNIDLVVIDIDLTSFDMGKNGKELLENFNDLDSSDQFLREAGFHLYLKLLKTGFSNDRIVFLTGNTDIKKITSLWKQYSTAYINQDKNDITRILLEMRQSIEADEYNVLIDLINSGDIGNIEKQWALVADKYEKSSGNQNTYPKFYERFQAARLPLPKDIHKDNNREFSNWLRERLVNTDKRDNAIDIDYITLRRGIIEGCQYLKERLLKQSSDWILFNKTTEANLDKAYLTDYLTKLEYFLPLNPPENKKSLLYRFLKELSAEWEMSKGYFLKEYNIKNCFKEMCQNQMKLLRNWTAHSQLTDDITEKEVAFFFMLAMRAWFDLNYSEIQDYEKVLSEIFDKNEITNIPNHLAKSYQSLRKELGDFNPRGNEFSDLIKSLIKKSKDLKHLKNLSKPLFYQNFWHGLFPASLKIARQREDKDSVAMFVNFEYQDIPENSFPYFLGALIYKESF